MSSITITGASTEVDDLDLMFERAISGTGIAGDALAIEALVGLVRAQPPLAERLQEKIGKHLLSSSIGEVQRTIDVLDTCMHAADDPFRHQIGRYKFLNQIVKLLAPKLSVRPAPAAVRQRLMDLLLVWSARYAYLPKFRTVYDTLRRQHVDHQPPSDHRVAERVCAQRAPGHERTVFDAIPRELLLSRDPADVQTAKLLIQQALEREQRELALRQQHRAELAQAAAVAQLLGEMLAADGQRDAATERSADDESMLRELYEQCRSLQISVAAFAASEHGGDAGGDAATAAAVVAGGGEVADEAQTRSDMAQLLRVNDALQTTIQRYTTVVLEGHQPRPAAAAAAATTPATSRPQPAAISNTDLLTAFMDDKPLSDSILALAAMPKPEPQPQRGTAFDDIGALDDIFSNRVSASRTAPTPSSATDELLLAESDAAVAATSLLSPTSQATDAAVVAPPPHKRTVDDKQPAKPVSELDMFGLESVITGLKNNLVNSQPEKVAAEVETTNSIAVVLEPGKEDNSRAESPIAETAEAPQTAIDQTPALTPLAQLHVDLAAIRPAPLVPARIVHDDPAGLKVVLHFALDRPRPDVSVCVLTCTNQSALPVHGLRLDASASRPCRVRQLDASGTALPACKPFRPPADDVTQLLLVAHADGARDWDMTCILSYNLGGDPDQMRESISVRGLRSMAE